jgi:hypothetical protein
VSGDLTAAINFARPDFGPPQLPLATSGTPSEHPECVDEELTMASSPHPRSQAQPTRERGSRPYPSGPVRMQRQR